MKDFSFVEANDESIHEWLIQIDSVGTASKNNEPFYFIQKPLHEVSSSVSKESKRKTSSPLVSSQVKRSRSAPENEEPSTPTHSRQARSVKFKDQPNKPMKTRSRSEHRPQRIMVSIFLPNFQFDHYVMLCVWK